MQHVTRALATDSGWSDLCLDPRGRLLACGGCSSACSMATKAVFIYPVRMVATRASKTAVSTSVVTRSSSTHAP